MEKREALKYYIYHLSSSIIQSNINSNLVINNYSYYNLEYCKISQYFSKYYHQSRNK